MTDHADTSDGRHAEKVRRAQEMQQAWHEAVLNERIDRLHGAGTAAALDAEIAAGTLLTDDS